MRRLETWVCPACLAGDAEASDMPPEVAMYGRAWWRLGFVRTCPEHDRPLLPIASGVRRSIHDFVADLRPWIERLPHVLSTQEPRSATRLERYVVRRVSEPQIETALTFLDSLQTCVAAKFCEVIGTVRNHGRSQHASKLDETELLAAGDAGYGLAAGGEAAIRGFILDLLADRPTDGSHNGKSKFVLGSLDAWLWETRRSADHAPLRRLIREVVIENLPLGPGDICCGEPVEHRILHSVTTAARKAKVHVTTMRKLLVERGLVVEDGLRLCDNRVTFPAADAEAFLERLSDAMGLPEVRRHLNVPRISADLLHRAGLLKPLYGASFAGKHRLAFARADVDAFLGQLLRDVEAMDDEVDGALPIAQAAHSCFCNSMDIVRMVLDRELPWVGRRSGERGYLSIRVRLDDVRERIDACRKGLSVAKSAQDLRVPIHVLRNLIRHGMIRTGG